MYFPLLDYGYFLDWKIIAFICVIPRVILTIITCGYVTFLNRLPALKMLRLPMIILAWGLSIPL